MSSINGTKQSHSAGGKAIAGILIAAFAFATMEAVLKFAAAGFDSMQLTAVRFFIGGLVLLPFGLASKKRDRVVLSAKDHLWLLLLGVVCIPVSMMLFQMGVVHSNASTASVLFCVNPLTTMVLAHFFAGERMTRRKAAAFAISLLGILMMIRPWDIQEGNTVLGLALMLLAALTFSIYTIMGKKTLARIGNTLQTSISFLYGAAVLLLVMLVMKKPVAAGIAEHWVLILYISVFVTGIGYLAYFKAIEYSDATTGSITFLIKPAIAPFIAMALLKERMLWNSYVGLALILVASLINLFENRARQRQTAETERSLQDETA